MFSKLFLIGLVAACLFTIQAQPASDAANMIHPASAVRLTTANFANTIDTIRDNWGNHVVCKGLMLTAGCSQNLVVEINLIHDPAGTWTRVVVQPGIPIGYLFRMIRSTNTTAPLDSIIVFPMFSTH